MKHLKICLVLITVSLATMLAGCNSLEDYFVKDQPDAATINGPMTAIEYTNKINRTILPIMNDSETLLANHLEVVKGNYPIAQEVALVEGTLDKTQSAIEEADKLYPPKNYAENKAQTIVQLNNFKDALKRYEGALEAGDKTKINSTADNIKLARESLKTVYGIYQN